MILLNDFFQIVESGVDPKSGQLTFKVRLNASHVIYKAHFPGMPITPGVCIIQMVTECLQQHLEEMLQLEYVKNVKFLNTIIPDGNKEVEISFSKILKSDDGKYHVQATVCDASTTYAKISVIYD